MIGWATSWAGWARDRRILLYDSHIDTVDIGDRSAWGWDPFQGKVENGILYARGAGDEKQSTPGMLYGIALARELGLLDGLTVYYFGNMEEDCDGLACQALVECEGLRPDCVIVGEPTEMNVYRGHKGRVELKAVAKGRSIHAASNQLGDNAIYKICRWWPESSNSTTACTSILSWARAASP